MNLIDSTTMLLHDPMNHHGCAPRGTALFRSETCLWDCRAKNGNVDTDRSLSNETDVCGKAARLHRLEQQIS